MITVVSGFGRCGSSLIMQMLVAGGMPSFGGEYPAFEAHEASELPSHHQWLKRANGYCVKILDPHIYQPPRGYDYRFIWIDRNPQEQAKSQAKFLHALIPSLPKMGLIEKDKIANSFNRDRSRCFSIMENLSQQILSIYFEEILQEPLQVAKSIVNFCGYLDQHKMVLEVIDRPPECLPYLLELELLAKKGLNAV